MTLCANALLMILYIKGWSTQSARSPKMNRYKTSENYHIRIKTPADDMDINGILLEHGRDGGIDREDMTTVLNPNDVSDYKLQPAEAHQNSSHPGEDDSKHTTSGILFTKR